MLAAELPDHAAGRAVDLVAGAGVAAGDDQVVVGRIDRDRVDVKVVPGVGRLGRRRIVGLGQPDVLVRAPLEEDLAGGDVDLLHDPVEVLPAPADARVRADRLSVGGEQRRALIGEQELVQIALIAVAGVDLGDLVIVLVIDLVVALAVGRDHRAHEIRHHRLVLVGLNADVEGAVGDGRLGGEWHESRPAGRSLRGSSGPAGRSRRGSR